MSEIISHTEVFVPSPRKDSTMEYVKIDVIVCSYRQYRKKLKLKAIEGGADKKA